MPSENQPPILAPRTGPLRNGNPRGNPQAAPRCGAHTRDGGPCRQPALANGRCRLHGGNSTGPRTEAGKAATRAAHTTHGFWSEEGVAFRQAVKALLVRARAACRAPAP